MIPSDHFVKFYNEIFKYLERRGGDALDRYYARVADRQAYFTLEAFKRGVQTVTTNCAKKQLDEYNAGEGLK